MENKKNGPEVEVRCGRQECVYISVRNTCDAPRLLVTEHRCRSEVTIDELFGEEAKDHECE